MDKLSKLFEKGAQVIRSKDREQVGQDGEPFPSPSDLFRYRKQRGVNLGSWFVLEKWIAERPYRFAKEPHQSDLDVARGANAKEVLEEHWDTWITEEDWRWIAARGINTVRIPIGYYHVCGADPSVLRATDFADYQHVFEGAWSRITNAIVSAHRHGIGVLIDLHAAPGKQNRDAHSGTSAKNPEFFKKRNLKRATEIWIALMENLSQFTSSHKPPLHNLVGVELVNEPAPGNNAELLEEWYIDTSRALRLLDPQVPIYVGDAWMTDHYAEFVARHTVQVPFLVVDHHLYRCFTGGDIKTPAEQHVRNLTDPNAGTPKMLSRVSQKLVAAGGALVIGEWSGALNPGSLSGANNQVELRRQYIQAQLSLYEAQCAGWYFWTYKKERSGDKGWSLRDAVGAGVFPMIVGLRCAPDLLHEEFQRSYRRQIAKDKAAAQHVGYWSQYPGKYEHWRFEDGFNKGWDDGWMFFVSLKNLPPGSPIPELGFKGPWSKRRLKEHIRDKGDGAGLWEYEHGFSQGVVAAERDLLGKLGVGR